MLTFAVLAGLIIIGLLGYEVSRWPVRGRILTRRQKFARVASGVVALGILALMVVGTRAYDADDPILALMCWFACLGLASGLVALALLDLRDVGIGYGEQRKRMLRDLTGRDEDEPAGGSEQEHG